MSISWITLDGFFPDRNRKKVHFFLHRGYFHAHQDQDGMVPTGFIGRNGQNLNPPEETPGNRVEMRAKLFLRTGLRSFFNGLIQRQLLRLPVFFGACLGVVFYGMHAEPKDGKACENSQPGGEEESSVSEPFPDISQDDGT